MLLHASPMGNIFEWGKFLTFKFHEFFRPNLHLGGKLEFVTCGVELLMGHCTDIPADQGSWKQNCAICSF